MAVDQLPVSPHQVTQGKWPYPPQKKVTDFETFNRALQPQPQPQMVQPPVAPPGYEPRIGQAIVDRALRFGRPVNPNAVVTGLEQGSPMDQAAASHANRNASQFIGPPSPFGFGNAPRGMDPMGPTGTINPAPQQDFRSIIEALQRARMRQMPYEQPMFGPYRQ